ncbi:Glycolipid transfer protein 3, partial [Mucuna pruriens]
MTSEKCCRSGLFEIKPKNVRTQFLILTSLYTTPVEILKPKASKGNTRKRSSCSKAFLLFTSCLISLTNVPLCKSLEQIVQTSYNATLSPWHGWISSIAFRVMTTSYIVTKMVQLVLAELIELVLQVAIKLVLDRSNLKLCYIKYVSRARALRRRHSTLELMGERDELD